MIRNPKTGKLVKANGKIGKMLMECPCPGSQLCDKARIKIKCKCKCCQCITEQCICYKTKK